MAGQVSQCDELRLRLVHALLKDIDTGFGSDACAAYHSGSWFLTYVSGADGPGDLSSFTWPTILIRPWPWSFPRSSFVQTSGLWRSAPTCGPLAARNGLARKSSARLAMAHRWRFMGDSATLKILEGTS